MKTRGRPKKNPLEMRKPINISLSDSDIAMLDESTRNAGEHSRSRNIVRLLKLESSFKG